MRILNFFVSEYFFVSTFKQKIIVLFIKIFNNFNSNMDVCDKFLKLFSCKKECHTIFVNFLVLVTL